jgi:hypothetical protein
VPACIHTHTYTHTHTCAEVLTTFVNVLGQFQRDDISLEETRLQVCVCYVNVCKGGVSEHGAAGKGEREREEHTHTHKWGLRATMHGCVCDVTCVVRGCLITCENSLPGLGFR